MITMQDWKVQFKLDANVKKSDEKIIANVRKNYENYTQN